MSKNETKLPRIVSRDEWLISRKELLIKEKEAIRVRLIPRLRRINNKMDWNIPWYSSFGSDFNYDFHATMDEAVTPV